MQGTWQGYEMVRRMAQTVKQLDTTRPVTAAQSNSMLSRFNASQAADVAGFNYQHGEYDNVSRRQSDQTDRQFGGHFGRDDARRIRDRSRAAGAGSVRHRVSALGYDASQRLESKSPSGRSSRAASSGRGSTTTANRSRSSGRRPLHRSVAWISAAFPRRATTFARRSGSTTGRYCTSFRIGIGLAATANRCKVMVLTNADAVELSLNGKSLGEKPVDAYDMVTWEVPYEPGKLEAIAKENGEVVARSSVETTGEPVSLELVPDRHESTATAATRCRSRCKRLTPKDASSRPPSCLCSSRLTVRRRSLGSAMATRIVTNRSRAIDAASSTAMRRSLCSRARERAAKSSCARLRRGSTAAKCDRGGSGCRASRRCRSSSPRSWSPIGTCRR